MDLRTQIRDYAQAVDSAQEPMSADQITELRLNTDPVRPIGLLTHPRRFRPRRQWLVAVATAVAVLALVGGAALLVQGTGSGSPVADTVPTTLAESTPTTIAESEPTTLPNPPSSSTWSRIPHDEAVFGGEGVGWDQAMRSVTVGGPGLVAVGTDGSAYDEGHLLEYGDAAVWTSPDGVTWSRVPHDEAIFGGASMNSVTAGGPGLVAVGGTDSGAAVWTSPDGITWSRVPHDEAIFGETEMSSVTVGGPGLVAVGPGFLEDGATVWTSPDGITWSRVPHDEAVFGGAGMHSVTAGGPGLVAVGWFEEDGENYFQGAAVWTSVDGFVWSRVPHDEAVFGGEAEQWMTSVTVGGPGLVAVGDDHGGIFYGVPNTPIWTSPDGITWSRAPYEKAPISVGHVMESVTAGGPGLVAVGWQANPWLPDKGARVWTSPDGITWSRVPHEAFFSEAQMQSVTAAGPGLVAVGVTWDTDIDAVVWVATTAD